ncbi:hypothetical protein [Kineosporia sp. NBRC 101731]|nr:hypothetical protein [Kineosporia sp. NBRC 101731]GLY32140.1 hypothetical protein Kisp02_55050 [Kineosporia sp. NBRC 101731]
MAHAPDPEYWPENAVPVAPEPGGGEQDETPAVVKISAPREGGDQ